MKITLFSAVALLLFPLLSQAQTTRIMLVGDSWAEEQWVDESHERVFAINGLGLHGIYGETTTESGSTAFDWKQADYLQRIDDALAQYPDVDTVQLTVGGNDFLDVWHKDMTEAQVDALTNAILFDLNLIIDYILSRDPGIEILLSLYDYPNFRDTLGGWAGVFACGPLHSGMGEPTPLELNEAAISLVQSIAGIASDNPRIHYVDHFGLMQYNFGFVEDGIPPGTIALPGDTSLPSPLESMRKHAVLWWFEDDCFHLTPDGYDIIVQNLINQYLGARMSGEALVIMSGQTVTYDGQPHTLQASTQPPGLVTSITYDGSLEPPVDAGTYSVVASLDQAGWSGQSTAALVIEPAAQSIEFLPLEPVSSDHPPLVLEAIAGSGLEVEFEVISGPATVEGNVLELDGQPGGVIIEARQPGAQNWQPADPVQQVLTVLGEELFRDRFEFSGMP